MSLPLKWEFPGGKIALGESAGECLKRELLEELEICVKIKQILPASTHHYPGFSVTLYPFICTIASDKVILHEHAAVTWLTREKLYSLDWAEADLAVLDVYYSRSGAPAP